MSNEAAAACGGTAVVGGGGGEEVGNSSGGSSPKNRMKFLCSYGGKIMPRMADGHLKYVGGETRVIGVPRDINFSELMKKLKSEFEGDMILKYQVIPEELDVLVSVRTDEDLKHMMDEYDRNYESGGTAKLRAFLFPSVPVVLDNQIDPHAEQRYIDAINNTVRSVSSFRQPPPIIANRPSFSLSASSSPRANSPDANTMDTALPHEPTFYHHSRFPMHKVHSSPSLYSLNAPHHQTSNHSNHHYHPPHHPHHQHHQHHHQHSYQSSSRPHHENHRLSPSLSMGRPEFGRAGFGPSNQYHSNVHSGAGSSNIHSNWSSGGHNNNFGGGFINKHEQSSNYGCRTIERLDSLPSSPKSKLLE
ncbi:uncharacterized protein LOC126659492 [Mercurialis annua]|uniref:uncharacterized protein LOC126659492 n=1 Tax=Mercurialis annua TaxID=3986 RepID=UPI00215EFFB3|nr:uncharacterized protein LOC126659492 [Mercurialis annua]